MKNISFAALLMSTILLVNCSGKSEKKDAINQEETFESEITQEEMLEETNFRQPVEENTQSEDWDVILKNYEEYIDNYIVLLKKSKAGDTSVMPQYMEMMENANKLSEKLGNANGELSAKQMSKFMELQNKLTNAALEMQ